MTISTIKSQVKREHRRLNKDEILNIIKWVEKRYYHKFSDAEVNKVIECLTMPLSGLTEANFNHYWNNKLWRLNNLYRIDDKDGNVIPFYINKAQLKVYLCHLLHPKLSILKSRQQGISTFWVIYFLDDAIFYNNFNIGLISQNQTTRKELLDKVKKAFNFIKPNIKQLFNVRSKLDSATQFSLSNGSKFWFDLSFRGSTLQRLHVSEVGIIAVEEPKKYDKIMSGALQTVHGDNLAIQETTSYGESEYSDNYRKQEINWNIKRDHNKLAFDDWLPLFLSWLDDDSCVSHVYEEDTPTSKQYFNALTEQGIEWRQDQKNFWIMKYRTINDRIYGEFPATADEAFRQIIKGTYYAKLVQEHVIGQHRANPNKEWHDHHNNTSFKTYFDSSCDLYAATDLGMKDRNPIIIGQVKQLEKVNELLLIDEFRGYTDEENANIPEQCEIMRAFEKIYNKTIKVCFLPHDGDLKDHETGNARVEIYKKYKPDTQFIVLDKKISRTDGIEMTKTAIINNMRIDIDRCKYHYQCLMNYKRKKAQGMSHDVYLDSEVHDVYSHGASSVRYLVMGLQQQLKRTKEYMRNTGL